jgi:hypothetical protein
MSPDATPEPIGELATDRKSSLIELCARSLAVEPLTDRQQQSCEVGIGTATGSSEAGVRGGGTGVRPTNGRGPGVRPTDGGDGITYASRTNRPAGGSKRASNGADGLPATKTGALKCGDRSSSTSLDAATYGSSSRALSSTAARTSCLRIRPPTPVPLSEDSSISLSAASLRTKPEYTDEVTTEREL